MIFGQDRNELRQMYVDAFRKARQDEPLSPLEAQLAEVIQDHPEYHRYLDSDALDNDFTPEAGQTNPFLHMGLHLALRDQLKTDRPPGIRALLSQLQVKSGDPHTAEHRVIDCLAETLWEAQSNNAAPDEQRYLERVKRILR